MAQGFGELQNKASANISKAGLTTGGNTLFEKVKPVSYTHLTLPTKLLV